MALYKMGVPRLGGSALSIKWGYPGYSLNCLMRLPGSILTFYKMRIRVPGVKCWGQTPVTKESC